MHIKKGVRDNCEENRKSFVSLSLVTFIIVWKKLLRAGSDSMPTIVISLLMQDKRSQGALLMIAS